MSVHLQQSAICLITETTYCVDSVYYSTCFDDCAVFSVVSERLALRPMINRTPSDSM